MYLFSVTGSRCRGPGCCTENTPCLKEEGDCNDDRDCVGELVCGKRNCAWNNNTDCCQQGRLFIYLFYFLEVRF